MDINAKNLFDLHGKVAIVTGAASGLGEGIAKGYAQYGAKVVIVDIDEKNGKRVEQEIAGKGGEATAILCDISKSHEVKATVDQTIAKYGKIDILFNNAGIVRRSMAEDMQESQWDEVLDVNLKGTFLFATEVGRHMIKRGEGGRIINMASIAALVGIRTGNANLCASKGGIISLTKCLAIEWAKHKILVNAIAPSHILTPLDIPMLEKNPKTKEYFINSIPLRRLGQVSEIVGPAIFLASDASTFITGSVLLVDGGHTAE